MSKVLLVDDELTMLQVVGEQLRSEGHQVVPFTSARAALEALDSLAPELVLANLTRDKTAGSTLSILQKARTLTPPALVILITGPGPGPSSVEALKRGAYDYLNKPFTVDELKLRVQRATSFHAAFSENLALRKQLHAKAQIPQIIGVSARTQSVLKLVEPLSESDSPVFIVGPTGSGKELVARAIHLRSRRRLAPFLALDCRSLPEHLLETELFGERKSPFHNGVEEKLPLLKEAEGGTLFLRGVAALPVAVQARLLGVLQRGEYQVPGDATPTPVDVRILAGNDLPLDRGVASGAILSDFAQRLSSFNVSVPALRERSEDIPLLIGHFLQGKIHRRTGQPLVVAPETVQLCLSYSWPENVRELENALEQASALSQDGTIRPTDLPRLLPQSKPQLGAVPSPAEPLLADRSQGACRLESRARQSCPPRSTIESALDLQALVPLKKFLRDQEVSYLQHILAQVDGSKEKAAELLGISLATIYRKLSEPALVSGDLDPISSELETQSAGGAPQSQSI
jgi:DNA-binding NtrC family response regulator